jgi:hypothetical protein
MVYLSPGLANFNKKHEKDKFSANPMHTAYLSSKTSRPIIEKYAK